MLDRIIHYSIRHKLIIGLLTLTLFCWGLYSLSRLPIDAVPDITNNQVQIITTSPALAAQEMERLVSFPIEQVMATIPDLEEARSISRFGLSVVTLVFEEDVDLYWARQQVNERLSLIRSQIPAGLGDPELGPLSTGLGEIYQYILRSKPGYEDQYDAAALRSIQDWIVRRQLLGTPGVADVSSFGGFVKQYEVTIDPNRLRSLNLSLSDVYSALEANNQNTGGAYIDKNPRAYFIRSEGLVKDLDDIRNIVLRLSPEGVPLLVGQVAEVRFGQANRYGAMTYNDQGEVVGALVLMLKGENSDAVVEQVKKRIEQIKTSLPEGVTIEPFLDRSELVGRAISTVQTNLMEGALIVIFVLVLFLGNLRAGLIVASVIPLALLFAVSLMQLFGVSGNLMSLGAIDFGLVVDGAVIVVEATLHHLGLRKAGGMLSRESMNQEVYKSASGIRNSAAFGEIIILIVYLPLLALVGVEGKMFRPMAQTVGFAILGAFLLSITYVPMMCALWLSRKPGHQENFSDRMMAWLQKLYRPSLELALRKKIWVLALSLMAFTLSLIAFLRMGGEFIPTLEEGDFAVETRLLPGSSLQHTVDVTLRASSILLKEYPDEVREVVGKIGAAEIPTDPMPMEACDLMVLLHPPERWKKAESREELAEKMSKSLEVIPGVNFGFLQPIQMRFNELMTGVKQDVALKIFGEDLDTLSSLAPQVADLVASVEGVKDMYVEEVTGMSQIVAKLDRNKMARYGLNVTEVNQAIHSAFAGQVAGLVYEGEKRYELVLRLDARYRQSLEDLSRLPLRSSIGNLIPLSEVAEVSLIPGPTQIQREDAKRRAIVGFNTRGRDVESVVEEIKSILNKKLVLPAGYYITYGGQFENLKKAKERLMVAVPIALSLIFILLYFTFQSFRQALLIFTAIPLASIGGVAALLLRGMPFSISAGVGFIALFGVAVLNGIVLVAEFNRLKKEDERIDLYALILDGTKNRLRPVLMTAAVASLGFLPMALAVSAGAEVQRPLATVVIGGLVSSTFLTLIVLPCLYTLIQPKKTKESHGS
jgi:heavy metal efflux system protein